MELTSDHLHPLTRNNPKHGKASTLRGFMGKWRFPKTHPVGEDEQATEPGPEEPGEAPR